MANETAAELRTRAAQARRIADNLHSDQACFELRQIADALEAEADKLERANVPSGMPSPGNGAT